MPDLGEIVCLPVAGLVQGRIAPAAA